MRFVPSNCLKEGMVLAKTILGRNGELLLNAGCTICDSYIPKIQELGYSGVYIEDDLSKDIYIQEVINEDLRLNTVRTIKNAYTTLENRRALSEATVDSVEELVNNIVDEIGRNKDLIVNMIDLKVFDDYTFFHSVNVSVLSIIVGAALDMNKDQLYKLGLAAMLHDIGKVFIPKEILNKNGRLSSREFEIVKAHAQKGYEYLKSKFHIPIASYVSILQHHERYDGTGYPMNASGESISLFARIIAVADVYDALTSERPYREALLPSEAIEYIMGGGSSLFDPGVVVCFIRCIAPYPIGTCVILSDNRVGLVVENYRDCCMRPKIKIFRHGDSQIGPYYIDLRGDKSLMNVTITGVAKAL